MSRQHPRQVALGDQIRAASREALDIAAIVAAIPPNQIVATTESIEARIEAWQQATPGDWRSCPHISASPEVVWGLLHRPGQVVCADCAGFVMLLDARARPDICDACGQPQPARIFHEVTIPLGPVLIGGNVCPVCIDPRKDPTHAQ
jgi:hypothetical protein